MNTNQVAKTRVIIDLRRDSNGLPMAFVVGVMMLTRYPNAHTPLWKAMVLAATNQSSHGSTAPTIRMST